MTDTLAPPRLTRLTFHGPLSEARASRLVGRLARTAPATVLDIGCGWGELMLRILEAVPAATGTGIDLNEDDLARGRANAKSRGLAQRVEFVAGGASAAELTGLAGLVDLAVAAGFREHRSSWLRGYRGVMGLAYLTLVPVRAGEDIRDAMS